MAFGQPSGPPAPAKLVQHLLSLLQAAGHRDFRDARGPMGFTQRQAAGKFTRDEAEAFIELLEQEADTSTADEPPVDTAPAASMPTPRPAPPAAAGAGRASAGTATSRDTLSKAEQALRKIPSSMLAAELQRRGWVIMEP
ncbi:MAG: hypothetical protein ACKO27_06470 [Ilumatobacteraceae bacterium]